MRLAGDPELVVLAFPKRPDGEELVAAGNTTIGRHTQEALKRGGKAGDVLGCDALEVVVAADRTVSGKAVGKRDEATTKTGSAVGAPPRQLADEGSGEIHKVTSARPTAGRRMAGGTNHQRCPLVTWDCGR